MHCPLLLTAVLLSMSCTLSVASPMRGTADALPTIRRLFTLMRLPRSNRNNEEDPQVTTTRTTEVTDPVPTVHQLIAERLARFYSYSSDDDRTGRKFPEVDSRGFDEDVFDEGFGEWEPMRRF